MTDYELDALTARLRNILSDDTPGILGDAAADAIAALRAARDSWRRTAETLEQEKVDAREEAILWRDRYSSLFVRVASGVPLDITAFGIFLSWQREIDAAYEEHK